MWTFVLTATGIVGMWLVVRHWYGWLMYLVNEGLWLAYALKTHDHPLFVMAWVWGAVGVRNLAVSWKAQHA